MTTEMEIPDHLKRQVLQEKLQQLRNTVYSFEIDVRISQQLGDAVMEATAKNNMANALKGLDYVKAELAKLPPLGEESSEEPSTD